MVAHQGVLNPIYLNGNGPYFLDDIDSLDNVRPVSAMVMEAGRPGYTVNASPAIPTEEPAEEVSLSKKDLVPENPQSSITEKTEPSVNTPPPPPSSNKNENQPDSSAPVKPAFSEPSRPNSESSAPPLVDKPTPSDNATLILPRVLEEDIFEIEKTPLLSHPVYDNIDYPENTVFSIQIGAFSKPISQTFYQNFSPVITENLNDQLKRYTVGLFATQSHARSALRKIRSMGYSDAFIIIHDNGKRMTVQQWKNR